MITIEKHNSHGIQLLVKLSSLDAEALAEELRRYAQNASKSGETKYITKACLFEDDNERWESADLDFAVGRRQ